MVAVSKKAMRSRAPGGMVLLGHIVAVYKVMPLSSQQQLKLTGDQMKQLFNISVDDASVEEFHHQSSLSIDSLQNQRRNELAVNRRELTKD